MIKSITIFLLLLSAKTVLADTSKEIECLAKNIYFEARNQSVRGQIAVGNVTINRVKDSRFPNSVCKVVTQAKKDKNNNIILNKCQFSWYCDGIKDTMLNNEVKEFSFKLAKALILGQISDVTHNSTHYHSKKVKPYWSSHLSKTVTIEDHHFYRWEK